MTKQNKRKRKMKPTEKPKTINEQIIELYKAGMKLPIIAQSLKVNRQIVAKVLYLFKQKEATIIRPAEPTLDEEESGLGVHAFEDREVPEEEVEECKKILKKAFPDYKPDESVTYIPKIETDIEPPRIIEDESVIFSTNMYDGDGNKTELPVIGDPFPPNGHPIVKPEVQTKPKIGEDFVKGVKEGIKACNKVLKEGEEEGEEWKLDSLL